MVIPCLCLSRFSSCTVHHKTAVIPVDIPMRWEPRTNQSNGLRLLIFLQPLGRALKNQNAVPTTPPCFSRRLRSSLLHCGFACGAVRRRLVRAPSIVRTKRKTSTQRVLVFLGAVKQSKSEPFPSDATSVASPKVTVCVPSL